MTLLLRLITVVVFALFADQLSADAPLAGRVYRIGFLGQTSAQDHAVQIAALRQGLRDLGYHEGKNVVIEYRWAEGKLHRLPGMAAELVRLKVDLIVTHGTPGSRAAKQVTTTIPIVIAAASDPVRSGVVASLSRPGGNVTGLSNQELDVMMKRLELLMEVSPSISRVAYLQVPDIQLADVASAIEKEEDAAARSLGLEIRRVMVGGANDLARAFSVSAQQGARAVVVQNTSLLNAQTAMIAGLAIKHRLPTIGTPAFAQAGGLLGYGPNLADMYRRAAGYIDRILKGTHPANLPIEQPTMFELIVNKKTAKALGLAVSESVLGRADQVIE